jgi:hypothetical protein
MGEVGESFAASSEAVVFLNHFKDLPDPRQLGKVIYPLDEVLLLCLLAVLAWAESLVDIARFGKKRIDLLRRFRSFRDGTPSHDQLGDIFVSAFAARQRLVLGQVKVAEKSNEIVAIPALLDMLVIEGAIVSIDAMGCQRHIAEQIVEKKADYVLALKRQSGHAARGCRTLCRRAAGQRLQGYPCQPRSNGRWRPRPYRNQDLHGLP